jgi:hypothetical protein
MTEKILPFEEWDEKDKKMKEELDNFKLTPEEAYHVSWALFNETQRLKRHIEEMSCKSCWKRNHICKDEDYNRDLRKLKQNMKSMERINHFFSPYHNRLGVVYK